MPKAARKSGTSASAASASARRTARPTKGPSDTVKPPATSVSAAGSLRGKSQSMAASSTLANNPDEDEDDNAEMPIDPNQPMPWRHSDELAYICRRDWTQELMIEYLCQKAFDIPPREISTAIPHLNVTTRDGRSFLLPRAYRVPLMFVAKFQWDSLKLVLTSVNPEKEWEEYKFDIIHLSRLCQHLFTQAEEAREEAVAKGKKKIDKSWRSPMFDRVLTRFYHRWFVSREWSLRKFWEEFGDEEYEMDILKNDWIRWAYKGHKGFTLTKEEVQNGITADQFMHGLGCDDDGVWTWKNDATLPPLDSLSVPDITPSPNAQRPPDVSFNMSSPLYSPPLSFGSGSLPPPEASAEPKLSAPGPSQVSQPKQQRTTLMTVPMDVGGPVPAVSSTFGDIDGGADRPSTPIGSLTGAMPIITSSTITPSHNSIEVKKERIETNEGIFGSPILLRKSPSESASLNVVLADAEPPPSTIEATVAKPVVPVVAPVPTASTLTATVGAVKMTLVTIDKVSPFRRPIVNLKLFRRLVPNPETVNEDETRIPLFKEPAPSWSSIMVWFRAAREVAEISALKEARSITKAAANLPAAIPTPPPTAPTAPALTLDTTTVEISKSSLSATVAEALAAWDIPSPSSSMSMSPSPSPPPTAIKLLPSTEPTRTMATAMTNTGDDAVSAGPTWNTLATTQTGAVVLDATASIASSEDTRAVTGISEVGTGPSNVGTSQVGQKRSRDEQDDEAGSADVRPHKRIQTQTRASPVAENNQPFTIFDRPSSNEKEEGELSSTEGFEKDGDFVMRVGWKPRPRMSTETTKTVLKPKTAPVIQVKKEEVAVAVKGIKAGATSAASLKGKMKAKRSSPAKPNHAGGSTSTSILKKTANVAAPPSGSVSANADASTIAESEKLSKTQKRKLRKAKAMERQLAEINEPVPRAPPPMSPTTAALANSYGNAPKLLIPPSFPVATPSPSSSLQNMTSTDFLLTVNSPPQAVQTPIASSLSFRVTPSSSFAAAAASRQLPTPETPTLFTNTLESTRVQQNPTASSMSFLVSRTSTTEATPQLPLAPAPPPQHTNRAETPSFRESSGLPLSADGHKPLASSSIPTSTLIIKGVTATTIPPVASAIPLDDRTIIDPSSSATPADKGLSDLHGSSNGAKLVKDTEGDVAQEVKVNGVVKGVVQAVEKDEMVLNDAEPVVKPTKANKLSAKGPLRPKDRKKLSRPSPVDDPYSIIYITSPAAAAALASMSTSSTVNRGRSNSTASIASSRQSTPTGNASVPVPRAPSSPADENDFGWLLNSDGLRWMDSAEPVESSGPGTNMATETHASGADPEDATKRDNVARLVEKKDEEAIERRGDEENAASSVIEATSAVNAAVDDVHVPRSTSASPPVESLSVSAAEVRQGTPAPEISESRTTPTLETTATVPQAPNPATSGAEVDMMDIDDDITPTPNAIHSVGHSPASDSKTSSPRSILLPLTKDSALSKDLNVGAHLNEPNQHLEEDLVVFPSSATQVVETRSQIDILACKSLEKDLYCLPSSSSSPRSQGVQFNGIENRPTLTSTQTQTETFGYLSPMRGQPLSPDATMVDMTSIRGAEDTHGPSDIFKMEVLSSTHPATPSAAMLMTSMMRNMADLLQCASGVSPSIKGKEREVDGPVEARSATAYDSPIVSALLDEVRSLKEELRSNRQRSQEEIENIKHAMRLSEDEGKRGVDILKHEMRLREDKGKNDLELVRQHHREELEALRNSLRLMERDKEKVAETDDELRMPALELLELRRRIASLENQSRSGVMTPERSASVGSGTPMDVSFVRKGTYHPLGHLFDYEDPHVSTSNPLPSSSGGEAPPPRNIASARIERHALNGMDIDETIPLPIKSQRKFHALNRSSLG